MEVNKKQLLMDKYNLKKLKENLDKIKGITIKNIHNASDVCEDYVFALNQIYRIEFPILMTRKKGGRNYEYIEYLYKYLKLSVGDYSWLIPYFNGNRWWIELEIKDLDSFVNFYWPDIKAIDLTVIDTKNKLVFDIEKGEVDFEYRIKWI